MPLLAWICDVIVTDNKMEEMKLKQSYCASASWYHQLSFNLLVIYIEPLPYLSAGASSAALKSVKKKRGQRQRAEAEDRGREQRQRGAKGAAQANVCEILSLSFVLSPHTFFLFQLQWKCCSSTASPGSPLEPT